MYEFKDGDRILVANEEEYKKLLSLLHEQGYEWGNGGSLLDETECEWDCITTANSDKIIIYTYKTESRKYVAWGSTDIIPFAKINVAKINGEKRFTAAEAFEIFCAEKEICENYDCIDCPINRHNEECCDIWQSKNPEKTIELVWEYIKEKKVKSNIEAAIKLCEELGCPSAAEELRKMVRDE